MPQSLLQSQQGTRNQHACSYRAALVWSFEVEQNASELQDHDRATRKILNINRSLHPRTSVPRTEAQSPGRLRTPKPWGAFMIILSWGLQKNILRWEDSLLRYAPEHKFQEKAGFLFKAAVREAENWTCTGKIGFCAWQGQDGTPMQRKERTPRVNLVLRVEEHMRKNLHTVFLKHIKICQPILPLHL